jgi:Ca2+-binding EF-hand superfamily protein
VAAAAFTTRSKWVKEEEKSMRNTALGELDAFDARLQAEQPCSRERVKSKAHQKAEAEFRRQARLMFYAIDADGSGMITHEELVAGLNESQSFLRMCGIGTQVDSDELLQLASSWDLESFTRFALWHMRRVRSTHREQAQKEAALVEQAWMVFLSIDVNGDGQLDKAELVEGVKTNRALQRLFKGSITIGDFIPDRVDLNRDGAVTFDEFKAAVMAETKSVDQEALDDAAFACESGDLAALFG